MSGKAKVALTTSRPCPRCDGRGYIPCDGKEWRREESAKWAQGYDRKPVVINHLGRMCPGLAVAGIGPGGWGYLKVYLGIDSPPRLFWYSSFDVIGEHKLFWTVCSWARRMDVQLMESCLAMDSLAPSEKFLLVVRNLLTGGQE